MNCQGINPGLGLHLSRQIDLFYLLIKNLFMPGLIIVMPCRASITIPTMRSSDRYLLPVMVIKARLTTCLPRVRPFFEMMTDPGEWQNARPRNTMANATVVANVVNRFSKKHPGAMQRTVMCQCEKCEVTALAKRK